LDGGSQVEVQLITFTFTGADVALHPDLLVTVTWYVPDCATLMFFVVAPVDHR
jgi:hypothetical protein